MYEIGFCLRFIFYRRYLFGDFFFVLSFWHRPVRTVYVSIKKKMKLNIIHRWLHVPDRLSRSPVRFGAVRSLTTAIFDLNPLPSKTMRPRRGDKSDTPGRRSNNYLSFEILRKPLNPPNRT